MTTRPRRAPITPARLLLDAEGRPCAPDYGDVYHPRLGALAQARHVFIAGNDLPARWAGRQRFVILETGFGLGNNFLATWATWRALPPEQRCERLVYLSIEKHPLTRADAERMHAGSELRELAAQLVAAWPPATPDLHSLDFDQGRVQLLLALGDIDEVMRRRGLLAEVDAFYLDGFAPAANPAMWSAELMQRLAKLAVPGTTTAATWSAARPLRDALAGAGFEVERRPGLGSKVHMTTARYAPRFTPPRPAAWAPRAAAGETRDRRAIVIGAGLAGCAAAHGLMRQGWQVTLIDALPEPAMATSGNPAGLMHPIINLPDSPHARWFRAAALRTAALARAALACPPELPGQLDAGLLRLTPDLPPERARAQLQALGLPAEVVDWLDAEAASALGGLPPQHGAWHFGAMGIAAGWLSPAAWCRQLLGLADSSSSSSGTRAQPPLLHFIGHQPVSRIRREPTAADASAAHAHAHAHAHTRAPLWHALNAQGRSIAAAPVLVLANADGAIPLLAEVQHGLHAALPARLERIRGQTTVIDLDALSPARRASLHLPRLPVSGQGYAIHIPAETTRGTDTRTGTRIGAGARLLVGATSQPGDTDPQLRLADQHENLKRAAALGIFGPGHHHAPPDWALTELPLAGRVGWRLTAPDRLPLIGPPVDLHALEKARAARARVDALRLMPRCHDEHGGVYLCTGLASRGITSAVLAGEMLAAWVTGAPCPGGGELRDVADVGRLGG
jgi:tRNA 5-methylaminomethyl-2-thiouridine biosynthesis bifunctional protein